MESYGPHLRIHLHQFVESVCVASCEEGRARSASPSHSSAASRAAVLGAGSRRRRDVRACQGFRGRGDPDPDIRAYDARRGGEIRGPVPSGCALAAVPLPGAWLGCRRREGQVVFLPGGHQRGKICYRSVCVDTNQSFRSASTARCRPGRSLCRRRDPRRDAN